MKNAILAISVISIFFLMPINAIGQKKISDFTSKISNNKLKFEVAKVGTSSFVDSNKILLPKNLVFVRSIDVNTVLSKVGKQNLIDALIPLLKDNNKDWYANVLLYQITQRDATVLTIIENKNDWTMRNRESDIKYWNNYVNKR